jgi:signal peptidase I
MATDSKPATGSQATPEAKPPTGLGKLWAMVSPPPGPTIRRGDSSREIVETVVFVVVLVLLLKSFVAEAFVIPTGSMAETLYGYQKNVKCPECEYVFPVNCSQEIEGQNGMKIPGFTVNTCTCPNCRLDVPRWDDKTGPEWKNGDRVLVAKFIYDTGAKEITPFDVVVFKFPEQPQRDYTPMNYIKRLIGKPGQTIGIHYGDLFVAEGIAYGDNESDRPLRRQTHRSDPKAKELLENRGPDRPSPFHILRKPPDKILAMRRIVYDNDHQAKDLIEAGKPPRWSADSDAPGWKPKDNPREPKQFHCDLSGTEQAWLGYQHLMRNGRVELITDFIGYNTGNTPNDPSPTQLHGNWVGDLLIECQVNVEKAEGELTFDLAKGVDRFQARFQLSTGTCALVRLESEGKDDKEVKEVELDKRDTPLKKPGEYRILFANVDERLTLWVDKSMPFGDGVNYEPPTELAGDGLRRVRHGPTENDLKPVKIGARGAALTVHSLKLTRDTYYTDWTGDYSGESLNSSVWSDPKRFDDLRHLPATTLYVQPKHYLCLGDNSPASSDSRSWGVRDVPDEKGGLVPEELMLGRALMVYYPFNRFGPIR